jgi:hypothetical protein
MFQEKCESSKKTSHQHVETNRFFHHAKTFFFFQLLLLEVKNLSTLTLHGNQKKENDIEIQEMRKRRKCNIKTKLSIDGIQVHCPLPLLPILKF